MVHGRVSPRESRHTVPLVCSSDPDRFVRDRDRVARDEAGNEHSARIPTSTGVGVGDGGAQVDRANDHGISIR